MGLFDFLHGGKPIKSEAEAYMEQRNREYARKSAEYKRIEKARELVGETNSTLAIMNKAKKAAVNMLGALLGEDMSKWNAGTSQTMRTIRSGNTVVTIKQTTKKVVSTSAQNSTAFNSDCDDCNSTPSLYDGKEDALFIIDNVFAKPSLGTVTANGVIRRGRFEIGDKVQIKTPLEVRDAVIANMSRKGEKIEYANVSSGEISLVFASISDMMLRKGDQITQQRFSLFK